MSRASRLSAQLSDTFGVSADEAGDFLKRGGKAFDDLFSGRGPGRLLVFYQARFRRTEVRARAASAAAARESTRPRLLVLCGRRSRCCARVCRVIARARLPRAPSAST